jgi:regulator of protease activity HflC (stomatin/prohibitin superfamily)
MVPLGYIYASIAVIIGIIAFGIRIVRPTHKLLVETLGRYSSTKEQGFSWVFPIIQRTNLVNVTEQMVDVLPQTVITKDNLNAVVDAVVYYRINDAMSSQYNVDNHEEQLTSLTRTTLRAVIGKMTLTEANENRDAINQRVEQVLDKETKSYGVEVLRVELQRIEPPQDVQQSMNEVVKAERKRIASSELANAVEIEADGRRRASIKEADGKRQASILEAEGKAKAFALVNESFKGNAQLDKKLDITRDSLMNNSKIILTTKGINPQIILGDLPIKAKKE